MLKTYINFNFIGVYSISADYHKYGQSCKGVSICLFRTKEYRRNVFHNYPHWNGGIHLSQTYNGARSPIYAVSAYCILLHLGKQHLAKQCKEISATINKIVEYVRKELPEIEVIGDPKVTLN